MTTQKSKVPIKDRISPWGPFFLHFVVLCLVLEAFTLIGFGLSFVPGADPNVIQAYLDCNQLLTASALMAIVCVRFFQVFLEIFFPEV